jgi:hypothetical protein
MRWTRVGSSEDPYANGDKEKQDEAMSVERAGARTPYSTAGSHGEAVFPPWTDFFQPKDIELLLPRFYTLGPLFPAVEVACEYLRQDDMRRENSCLFRCEHRRSGFSDCRDNVLPLGRAQEVKV